MNLAALARAGLLGGILLLGACATAPTQVELAPPEAVPVVRPTGKSATVGPVSGGKQTRAWDVPTIEDGAFRDAMLDTLRRSRLFEPVSTDPDGAYRITAEIVSQEISGTFDNTIMLLVRYQLLDGASGKPLWAGNLYSQQELSTREVFAGQERMRRLQTMAVRDNLRQLLGQLDRALGRP